LIDSGTDVTVSIVDLRWSDQSTDHTVLATTTVTQDTFTAALTGAAGYSEADGHRIPVNASTAVVGRPYLLVDAEGNRELVHLSSISGTTSARSLHALRRNYATSDTLRGVELAATFPGAEADDEDNVEDSGGPYLVTWTYVVGGQTVVMPTTLWLDRYSLSPPIDDAWVLLAQPDMASRGRENLSSAIAAAWQDFLAEVQSHGKDPSLFPPSHTVRVGLRKLALAYLNRWASGGDSDNAYADKLEGEAYAKFSDVLVGRAPKDQVQLTRDNVGNIAQPKGHLFRLS
jgi:hypothetical protein